MTLNVDNKSSRRTMYDGAVHDPLDLSVETISIGATASPLFIGSQTAKSAYLRDELCFLPRDAL